ncbi:hypothetical protein HRG_006072 [Hirsutella rhossiliensis]|uniref:Uncharacterized protein n=1 Tax=Hirsutella rhossiliensis TaxID=111463 RepID=A0A9P8MYZ1_9HYPO|nr:uncharacterized protein HRG_06072 [Hirsutella rhossiliensis]KAH0963562.1 hypothetical protein HRG_06072 [Hirsutella rhossiliensis]
MRFASAASRVLAAVTAGRLCAAALDVAGAMERAKPSTKQCSGTQDGGGDECRTAAQAAPHIVDSFRAHNISCVQEAACLVSLMLLESAGLQFKHNVSPSPGVLGQGTANMQSPKFNLLYAKDVVAKLPDDLANATDADGLGKSQKAAMMALVTQDNLNFASAAWFHKTQCADQAVKAKLRDGGLDGCGDYLQTCVGTKKDDPSRVALNEQVYKEMGVDSAQQCVPLWEC